MCKITARFTVNYILISSYAFVGNLCFVMREIMCVHIIFFHNYYGLQTLQFQALLLTFFSVCLYCCKRMLTEQRSADITWKMKVKFLSSPFTSKELLFRTFCRESRTSQYLTEKYSHVLIVFLKFTLLKCGVLKAGIVIVEKFFQR